MAWADGKVDEKDMATLVADWGKSNSGCDIAPFAWGDGVVDEKDLGVLMESLAAPKPKASDVPCDVILSWISSSFASACDVYLGASQETVNMASRANPRVQALAALRGRPAPLEAWKSGRMLALLRRRLGDEAGARAALVELARRDVDHGRERESHERHRAAQRAIHRL